MTVNVMDVCQNIVEMKIISDRYIPLCQHTNIDQMFSASHNFDNLTSNYQNPIFHTGPIYSVFFSSFFKSLSKICLHEYIVNVMNCSLYFRGMFFVL